MSRSGTREISAALACSSRKMVCARTSAKNQSRKRGVASTTPPPRKYWSGSRKFAAMVNSRPSAIACCLKIVSAISSPSSAYLRTSLAAALIGIWARSWPGYLVSQYGSRLFWIPVSEATLSASPD